MEPKYKVNPLTGELQEYVFEYNGILALRNFTAKVDGERLILHAADDVNFSILEALVSEVEINGVVYDNPTAAQEALTRLTFNQNRPVLLDKSLKDLILNAVQKIPGKKLTTEDFTTELRTKLEGFQQVDISGLLPKGAYTGNASSLKSDIDKKVDKVAGKGLSSNDYTNEEKRKNEENALKRVANITVTGDVNKIITITFADSTVMQAPFKDNDHIPLADVHMNSLNFNVNTGVLTGIKSDGNAITVTLDGRYALISHNHDERYAAKTHTHSEYAYRTHRHNKDDIDGLPANIATTDNIKTAIEGIQIGGRNYIVGSNVVINSAYNQTMRMSNELIAILNSVRLVTVSVYIEYSKLIALGKRRLGYEFVITYTDNSKHYVHAWKPVSEADLGKSYKGRFSLTHALHNGKTIQSIASTGLHVQCTAENVKLGQPKVEIGNKPTDWSPAPEDLPEKLWTKQQHSLYGEINSSDEAIVTKEIFLDSTNSKTNLWTSNSELNVGSRNSGGYSRINCKGYKIHGKDNNYILLAGGDSIHKDVLLGKKGYVSDGGVLIQEDHSNSTMFMRSSGNFELSYLESLTSCSFRKVFDGGSVTFSCTGKNIIYTGDNQFNGKKGSTAVVSIYENDCYIDIRNV